MKRVATAVVLIPIVLLLILRAPIVLLAAVVAVVAVLTARELLDLSTHYNIQPLRTATYVGVVVIFLAVAVGMQSQPQLLESIAEFQKRERRYGGLIEQPLHDAEAAAHEAAKAVPMTAK